MTKALQEQLEQLRGAGFRGVESGDLINKPATRELVRMGLADNGVRGGGSPSALSRVYISQAGRQALAEPPYVVEQHYLGPIEPLHE